MLRVDAVTSPDDTIQVLDEHVATIGLDPAAIPYLSLLLGVEVGSDVLARQSAAGVRRHTTEAIRDLILRDAASSPMALIVEDVHWVDKASEDVLGLVVEAMASVPLLVVIVYRPEYLNASTPPPWGPSASTPSSTS